MRLAPFVHDLHAFGPGTAGELALNFEFAELRFVVGVGNRAGAQAAPLMAMILFNLGKTFQVRQILPSWSQVGETRSMPHKPRNDAISNPVKEAQHADAEQQETDEHNLDALPKQTPRATAEPENQEPCPCQCQKAPRIIGPDSEGNPQHRCGRHRADCKCQDELQKFHMSMVWLFLLADCDRRHLSHSMVKASSNPTAAAMSSLRFRFMAINGLQMLQVLRVAIR